MLLAPELHGAWAIELIGATRYVSAVAMEFVEGVSIEDLCEREDESGRLYPDSNPRPLYDTDDEASEHGIFDMSDEYRLKILADIPE
ncbi:hypothetical protein K4K53_011480 [Colletotrichum sp. SAR 10_77]|nr:hypothetical protein K4K53_011480 [Colletotrichum sp. SAR 10_77]